MTKWTKKPMRGGGRLAMHDVPRCGARTRRGSPCRQPGMANGRCRMHGGASTGPRTPEGIERLRRLHWKHGRRSRAAIAERRALAELRRAARATAKSLVE